jgi:glycosyltransferase involved in cell wall biosynthesis
VRFALVTTFFGPHRFGGDAAYVERLAAALLARGHQVEVFWSEDAFRATRGRRSPLEYAPPPGLVTHPLRTTLPRVAALAVHQTGGLGPYRRRIVTSLRTGGFDVVHLHNVSLVGGAELLGLEVPGAVRVMTVHEHWLACPLSVRWRFGREACPEPACVRCSILAARPPQAWRWTGRLAAAFRSLDAVIFPSDSSLAAHRDRGVAHPHSIVLPYFVPDQWLAPVPGGRDRAACVFVGRLVKEKGLQEVITLFRERPALRLDVVGDGPYRSALEQQARGMANVRFLGAVAAAEIPAVLGGALAVLVPSLFPETLCYVVLEAWSQGVPVLVSPAGALPGLVAGGGGHVCRDREAFAARIDRWIQHPGEAAACGAAGRLRCSAEFGEQAHVDRLIAAIEERRQGRAGSERP